MAKLRVALLSAAHLAMDMTTVAFVYVLIGVREFGVLPEAGGAAWYSPHSAAAIAACVLAYDLLAFGLQPFVGASVDLKKRAAPLLYASLFGAGLCAGVCVLCDFPQGIGAASAALLVFFSLCNAVFHVSAGAFVIAESEKSARRSACSCLSARSGLRSGGCMRPPCCLPRGLAARPAPRVRSSSKRTIKRSPRILSGSGAPR